MVPCRLSPASGSQAWLQNGNPMKTHRGNREPSRSPRDQHSGKEMKVTVVLRRDPLSLFSLLPVVRRAEHMVFTPYLMEGNFIQKRGRGELRGPAHSEGRVQRERAGGDEVPRPSWGLRVGGLRKPAGSTFPAGS